MKNEVLVSPYLDKRRVNKKGEHYVKLNVYNPFTKKKKLYATDFSFSVAEFDNIFPSVGDVKPRWKKDREDIDAILKSCADLISSIINKYDTFSFELFESEWLTSIVDKPRFTIHSLYSQAIEAFKANDQISTALNYEYSIRSLVLFQATRSYESLAFHHITTQWLNDYVNYMLNTVKKKKATIGIYLRPLRAILNEAIKLELIPAKSYPFGREKFEIPTGANIKKALSPEQLKLLYENVPESKCQLKAKAFWFFSYFCNGMNFKDITLLKFRDIKDDSFSFIRAKTSRTTKRDISIKVFLNEFTLKVIADYGNTDRDPDNFVFPVIEASDSAVIQQKKIKAFIKITNKHFKKFAHSLDIKEDVSTYFARHSFATNAIKKGMSIEFAGEALGHSDIKTTMNYFAGFDDEVKSDFAKKLMEF